MPMFSMDDFNQGDDFYEEYEPKDLEMGDFGNTLMAMTHLLKNTDYSNTMKSGHQLMMTIFNMTGLEPEEKNDQAFNVIMSLLSHMFLMLSTCEDKEQYFKTFDEAVIYPMLNGEANE